MRTPLALSAIVIFMAACSGSEHKTNTENIAVIEKYIKAVEDKDTKTMSDLLADNYVGYGPSFSDSTNKEQAIANWKNVAENLYDKIEYRRTVNITAEVTGGPHPGDYVSDWASLKITYKDGRGPVFLNMNAVYRVENGKITLSRTFYNEADVLRQLGYEFYAAE
ncbi:MAG TPA: nuclear transport factor 2 family protein [Chryseolinea sp.]